MLTNYVSEWEIYIGNSPVYFENPKCPGGSRLKSTFDEYYDEFAANVSPAFGFEKWCNMSGQYTFFEATGVPSVEASICSLGVFGENYIRDVALEKSILIAAGSLKTL